MSDQPPRRPPAGPPPDWLDPRSRSTKRRAARAARASGGDRGPVGPGRSRGPGTVRAPRGTGDPLVSLRTRRTVRAVIATVSFVILVASGIVWVTFQSFKNSIPHGSAVPALASGAHDPDGGDQNILLIGNDSRAGATKDELKALSTQDDGGSINADTMMVLHIPHNGSRPTLVSFPRDSWVQIPGHGTAKLNASYPDGYNDAQQAGKDERASESAGIILTIKTIEALTGLYIDHYAQVNLLGFYRISNAIGGVPVCLNAAQNDPFSGIDMPAGVSVIKGKQALSFVRQRHGLPGGDLDRIRRQQYFLASAFHKVESAGVLLNPFKLHDLLKAVGSSLLTDPNLDLLQLAQQFQNLSGGNVKFTTLPNKGPQTIYPDGVETSIVAVDRAAIPDFIRELQGKSDSALKNATAASPSSVTVDVLNGTDTVNLAAQNAAQLRELGFRTNTVDSADPTTKTTLEYPHGMESQVKAVAAVVPGATLTETSTVQRVTLVLGTNGVQVKGLAATPSSAPAAGTTKAAASASKAASPAARTNGLGCIN